jgi:carbonic anhydrase
VEFAVEQFATPLVVVLGHTQCGAVEATLQELRRPSEARSPNLHTIVDRIRPAVEDLLAGDLDPAALVSAAGRANVRASASQLREGSETLERRIQQGGLLVVGAEYALETGAVEFFDGVPAGSDAGVA